MKVTILQFPGTNCEYDTQNAFKSLGAKTEILWHKSEVVPEGTDLLVVAGGFSYGDYLRSGAIAKFSPVMQAVTKYAKNGGKVLGICNGFQVLTEAGLLPGALKRNESLHFLSKHHNLKVVNNDNIFLEKLHNGDIVNIPIA
ncbi:MAG: phosphoribosylformylglycinamidine synthase I, partial [Campylobacterota bacterium]